MQTLKKVFVLILVCCAAALGLTACQAGGTSTAQCAYIVGNGTSDRNIHQIILPGDRLPNLNNEEAQYIPCGPRNWIINDGQQKNANGDRVGDSDQVVQVWTKEAADQPRVQVNIHLKADWTLNEQEQALRNFYTLCYKYQCYNTDSSKANDSNFSTRGWNGMLSENFDPAIRTLAANVVSSDFTKDQVLTPATWVELGNEFSAKFADEIRRATGYSNPNLFCGSGDASGFTNADHKDFNCGNVRFTITKVEATNSDLRDIDTAKAKQAAEAAQADAAIANAKKLYGDNWSYVLGQKAIIDECRAAEKATCIVNIGGGTIAVPTAK